MPTNISIVSEAGIAINFQVESNVPAARRNIETLLKKQGRTSSTIMAGLLAVSPTKPIRSEAEVRHPLLVVNFRNQTLSISGCRTNGTRGEVKTERFDNL